MNRFPAGTVKFMMGMRGIESCLSFISGQARASGTMEMAVERGVYCAVTISRQAGCGALIVAEKVANYLQARMSPNALPWVVFDRNLMEKVLEDHDLPTYLARFLPEDRVSQFEDFLIELSAVYPPSYKVVEHTSETMIKLVGRGHVILIGRGGNLVTAGLPHMLHVRLVAPLEKRIAFASEAYHMTEAKAREFCLHEDLGRQRYLKKYFNADVNDSTLYHLIINTAMTGYEGAARLIGEAVLNES